MRHKIGRMRMVLAVKTMSLMQERFPRQRDKVSALAKKANVSRSSVQRVVNAEHGASIDMIESLAAALDVPVHELLQVKETP